MNLYAPQSYFPHEQNQRKPFPSVLGKSCNSSVLKNSVWNRVARANPESVSEMTQPAPETALSSCLSESSR